MLDPVLLEQGVRQLLVHHDALRLRFVRSESSWQQVNASAEEVVPFTRLDFSVLSLDQQKLAIAAAADQLQSSLNLSKLVGK
ncbi:MAG: hypothetical protein KME30_33330 [Iphinoe sp. HA4291-MV1]|nr:hypothetical protein [Iphinoe sp. HA4291-MV1]